MEGKVGRASSFRTSLQIQKQKLLEQSQVNCEPVQRMVTQNMLRTYEENEKMRKIKSSGKFIRDEKFKTYLCPRFNQMSSTDKKKGCSLRPYLYLSYHLI